ncbi:MAG: diacylglycerol kinase [Actinobacteria bacterium HGW-Actinobacteria-4]|nr:MAG: diacylglycerol kinase [Actinobacteria bacterium HGW-Actinobacteria-4]
MVLSITLASVALAIGIAALSLAIMLVRRVGAREPAIIPAFLRRTLNIRPAEHGPYNDYSAAGEGKEVVAFIANPTKDGISELREQAFRACANRYLPQPMWFHTTAEDPGVSMTREAIEAGANVVVAVGGDGTVRAVAGVAAEMGVPMGIVPMGTGNILARNLELPLTDRKAALRGILEGDNRVIDVGWLEIERHDGPDRDNPHIFLVIAGAGLDAEMVAGADAGAKRRLGWVAYFFAAMRHMGAKRMRATVAVDGAEPVDSLMRTVIFANCGKLPGGFQLVPDASMDDGTLDVATIDARGGVVGWTELFGKVVAQGAGIKQPEVPAAWRTSRIDHVRGTSIEVRMEHPQRVQADGESLGKASVVRGWVDPGALTVRIPTKSREKAEEAQTLTGAPA